MTRDAQVDAVVDMGMASRVLRVEDGALWEDDDDAAADIAEYDRRAREAADE